jgi:hypothetical protein
MNFPTLSAHAEEFLALKRAVAKVDPHRNTQDRRSVKHREMLAGRQVEIHTERDRKLEAAIQQRQSRRQQAA